MSFKENLQKKKDARDALIPVNVIADEKEEKVKNTSPEATGEPTTASNEEGNVEDVRTVEAIKNDLLSKYEEKAKKPTVEDTHIRTTFLFRKDLARRLDKLSKNKRGFKTMFINQAIEALLDELEK